MQSGACRRNGDGFLIFVHEFANFLRRQVSLGHGLPRLAGKRRGQTSSAIRMNNIKPTFIRDLDSRAWLEGMRGSSSSV